MNRRVVGGADRSWQLAIIGRMVVRILKEQSMSKVSVLVVDDASFIRDLVKNCLRNYFPGIRIEDAVNGRKAQA